MPAPASVPPPPFLRIVTVDYKSGDHLASLIAALTSQSDSDFEVVIVDNACPQGAARALGPLPAHMQIVTAPENLGFAGGCNLGARGARTEWIVTLNPDCVPGPDFVAGIKAAAARHTRAAALGATLVQASDPDRIDGFGDVLSIYGQAWHGGAGQAVAVLPDTDREVFAICGAAAAYRRPVFEAQGGFDTRFFCYLEDVDLSWRIRLAGGQIVQLRDLQVSHVRSVSSDAAFRARHSRRNIIWSYGRNAPLHRLPGLLVRMSVTLAYLTLRGSYGGGAAAHWRGWLAGLAGLPSVLARRRRDGIARAPRRAAMGWLSTSRDALRETAVQSRPIGPDARFSTANRIRHSD